METAGGWDEGAIAIVNEKYTACLLHGDAIIPSNIFESVASISAHSASTILGRQQILRPHVHSITMKEFFVRRLLQCAFSLAKTIIVASAFEQSETCVRAGLHTNLEYIQVLSSWN